MVLLIGTLLGVLLYTIALFIRERREERMRRRLQRLEAIREESYEKLLAEQVEIMTGLGIPEDGQQQMLAEMRSWH